MMELHVCNKSGQLLKAFALGDSEEIIIGRDETCDVRIKSQSVSREHCCIERDGHDLELARNRPPRPLKVQVRPAEGVHFPTALRGQETQTKRSRHGRELVVEPRPQGADLLGCQHPVPAGSGSV